MAHPFLPMTTELLKNLIRINMDSDQTINSTELPTVFETDDQKSILEINPQGPETNHPIFALIIVISLNHQIIKT